MPGLEPFRGSLEEIYDKFNKYKRTVPVRWGGAHAAALDLLRWPPISPEARCSCVALLSQPLLAAWPPLRLPPAKSQRLLARGGSAPHPPLPPTTPAALATPHPHAAGAPSC